MSSQQSNLSDKFSDRDSSFSDSIHNITASSQDFKMRNKENEGPLQGKIMKFRKTNSDPVHTWQQDKQRQFLKTLINTGVGSGGLSDNYENLVSNESSVRKIQSQPYRVLDAPNLKDDFYLNLVDWSSQN